MPKTVAIFRKLRHALNGVLARRVKQQRLVLHLGHHFHEGLDPLQTSVIDSCRLLHLLKIYAVIVHASCCWHENNVKISMRRHSKTTDCHWICASSKRLRTLAKIMVYSLFSDCTCLVYSFSNQAICCCNEAARELRPRENLLALARIASWKLVQSLCLLSPDDF